MADFRRLVAVALLSGLVAGILLSLWQHYQLQPLILAAERFEASGGEAGHDWRPANGFERNAFTLLFNGLSGFGFSLLICAAMYWQENSGYLRGLLWGIAGYAVFFAAPSLGLPPELPGTDSAALRDRQIWWLFTASATALGLALLFLGKNRYLQLAGALLLPAPHLLGAPHPEIYRSAAPMELQRHFVWLSAVSNALFWLTLGLLSGWLAPKVKL
jgi:cobalt transporter subunit CbtA